MQFIAQHIKDADRDNEVWGVTFPAPAYWAHLYSGPKGDCRGLTTVTVGGERTVVGCDKVGERCTEL